MFFLVFDVAKCIRAVNAPSNTQCIYTRPSRLSATQFTEKGHLAILGVAFGHFLFSLPCRSHLSRCSCAAWQAGQQTSTVLLVPE